MGDKNLLLDVDEDDFKFIESFSKQHNIKEGNGARNFIALVISDYKDYKKVKRQKND